MSNLQKKIMKSRLPPSGAMAGRRMGCNMLSRSRDYQPTMWDEFFAEREDIDLNGNGETVFRVYKSKKPENPGPVLLLLHGGGYSALTWSLFSTEITKLIHCQCVSIDLRGHGDTITPDDNDLSAQTLATDVGNLVSKLYANDCQPIMLIGHSMGGAIAVHISDMELINNLIGVTVIDVVEGTAMEALTSMQSFLRSRPNYFKSIPNAIEWCVRSGQVRNVESAKISMPGQIINCLTNKLATNELPLKEPENDGTSSNGVTKFTSAMSISEDEEIDNDNINITSTSTEFKKPDTNESNDPSHKYTWRIDLSQSEKYWKGWFEGLSEKFLNLRVPKQLLLASIDGLDKSLTVGQMQGKFQMQVLARCGHAVHEDRPHEVAEVIASYLIRNRFAEPASDFIRPMPAC